MFKKRYLLFPILFLTMSNAEIINEFDALNKSGKERMLTQAMMKDYVMIGMENFLDNPYETLGENMELFSETLDDLIKYNKNKEINKKLKKIKELWEEDKKILIPSEDEEEDDATETDEEEDDATETDEEEDDEEEVSKEDKLKLALSLHKRLDNLLKLSNDVTILFSKKVNYGEIINISGKQRMLSQRMASLYLLKSWGIKDEKINKELNDALDEFEKNIKKLKGYKKNTPEAKKIILDAEKAFLFLKMMNRSKTKFIPSLIFKKSNKLLKDMDKLTNIYIKQGGNK